MTAKTAPFSLSYSWDDLKIPPALWATGGFGLACQHPSLQLLHPMPLYCINPSNSYTQSFVLYWRRGLALLPPPPWGLESRLFSVSWAPRCHLSAIQAIIIFSSFFQHHFMSIFTRIWPPTWSKNPSKIYQKSIPRATWKTSNFLHRFFIDF